MRRTLMHGSRCAAASSGAVGRQPHGASRWGRGRTCMRAECSVQPIAFRVQRQPQLIGDRASKPATERYEPVEARSRQASAQRGQDGALASRVAPCARVLGRRGGGGRHPCMADSAAEEKLAQRQVAKHPLQQTRLQHGTALHGTARHGTAWRPFRTGGGSGTLLSALVAVAPKQSGQSAQGSPGKSNRPPRHKAAAAARR